MSEYQYYEWQTLERPLTAAEQTAVNALSSHIEVTGSQAIVSYDWGNFKHDPLQVLAKYFDAHLYYANWGTRRLAFRFQKGLLDLETVEAYCDEDHLTLQTIGAMHILMFELNNEGEYDDAWTDQPESLASLARLRDDLIQGDYRALYLAWLNAMSLEADQHEADEADPENFFNDPEPPVPAGLKKLTPALAALVDFFKLDPALVAAAAERSPNLSDLAEVDFAAQIARLSRAECNEFLLKIAAAEPGAVSALRKKLLAREAPSAGAQAQPRTFGQLRQTARKLHQAELKRQAEAQQKKHLAEMRDLASREAQIWEQIETGIRSGHSSENYANVTALLLKLQQLAEFQGKQTVFQRQLNDLAEKYKGRASLLRRWKEKGLL